MDFANRYFLELYFIITRFKLILYIPRLYEYSSMKYWNYVKLSLANISEIIYWHNINNWGSASHEENEFLISLGQIFIIAIFLTFALFSYSTIERWFVLWTVFPYAYWNIHCSQWVNSHSVFAAFSLFQFLIFTLPFTSVSGGDTAFTWPCQQEMCKSCSLTLPPFTSLKSIQQ